MNTVNESWLTGYDESDMSKEGHVIPLLFHSNSFSNKSLSMQLVYYITNHICIVVGLIIFLGTMIFVTIFFDYVKNSVETKIFTLFTRRTSKGGGGFFMLG